MNQGASIAQGFQTFAASVTAKMSQLTPGEPEDQLRAPFENFIASVATVLGQNVVCTGETMLAGRLGRPDYAVHLKKVLAGYVELKAPGIGANAKHFKGHNLRQFKRFSGIPNILYTDGNEWALYRDGKLIGSVVHLSGDVTADGKKAVSGKDAEAVEHLLRDFLSWHPIIPANKKGEIDFKGLSELLAPICRMLRDDVADALKFSDSPLIELAKDWRQLLFPDATNDQFADAYAQTVTFALLLGRSEGANPLTLEIAESALAAKHNLLSRALQVLTDPSARAEMAASLELLLRIIAAVPVDALAGRENPWLYFYEDFLAAYDPELRRDVGVYYTPIEVVHCQVRLIDHLLVNRLGKQRGFVDTGVITLDPAVGTGTYLLGVIEHALSRVEAEQGKGAIAGTATALARNLYGFELLVGPYAVSELRMSRALQSRGAALPKDGTHIYLTDTLESPHAIPPQLPLFLRPIAEQHAKALQVKGKVPVIVCLGNPPYDRHEAATGKNKARTGSWVRWGDAEDGTDAIFHDFLDPAVAAGHGVRVKNLYNLYVYFWRWALWKVFEHETAQGPGIVSFISASSYLDGDAFCGMREHMRRVCDEIWILDLGGEGRGTHKSENVFAIQTPVAVAIAVRTQKLEKAVPAKVHYGRIEGTREEKLEKLNAITSFSMGLEWQDCPEEWQAPFRPAGKGVYFNWPLLTDLLTWQHSGAQFKRTWPICPDSDVLKQRWRALLAAKSRSDAFKESRDRKIGSRCASLTDPKKFEVPIDKLAFNAPPPRIERYAYRSYDRQWIFADSRLGDYLRPELWRAHGDSQVYLTSLFSHPLGKGPALTASALIPDLDYFRGSYGAKVVMPLYRTSDASSANIMPSLLAALGATLKKKVTPEDFLAYVYGALAQPAFTARYATELETRDVRVPITKDGGLFEKIRDCGRRLLWLHTYGERYVPDSKARGYIPPGSAKCVAAVSSAPDGYPEKFEYDGATQTLRVSTGKFAPVTHDVFEFEVSGLKVVQSWLKYRMKDGGGKKSSPLDDIRPTQWTSEFTTELLELLWILEATLAIYPEQASLLEAVVSGDCFQADELPQVAEEMRHPPKEKSSLFDFQNAN